MVVVARPISAFIANLSRTSSLFLFALLTCFVAGSQLQCMFSRGSPDKIHTTNGESFEGEVMANCLKGRLKQMPLQIQFFRV